MGTPRRADGSFFFACPSKACPLPHWQSRPLRRRVSCGRGGEGASHTCPPSPTPREGHNLVLSKVAQRGQAAACPALEWATEMAEGQNPSPELSGLSLVCWPMAWGLWASPGLLAPWHGGCGLPLAVLQPVGWGGLPLACWPVTLGLWASPGHAPGCWKAVGFPERLDRWIYFLHLPVQGAPSPDTCQQLAASVPCSPSCSLEATPGPPAQEECQPGACQGSASPQWPPPTLGFPQA